MRIHTDISSVSFTSNIPSFFKARINAGISAELNPLEKSMCTTSVRLPLDSLLSPQDFLKPLDLTLRAYPFANFLWNVLQNFLSHAQKL